METQQDKDALRRKAHELMEDALKILDVTEDSQASTHLDLAIETLGLRGKGNAPGTVNFQ